MGCCTSAVHPGRIGCVDAVLVRSAIRRVKKIREEGQKYNVLLPELAILEKHWDDHFKGRAAVSVGGESRRPQNPTLSKSANTPAANDSSSAKEMVGNAFFSARDIVRAQCSTELGSIQQHRLTLDKAVSDKGKFAVLRIMAEELTARLSDVLGAGSGPDMEEARPGRRRQTDDRRTALDGAGRSRLDAFNIDFNDFLDNVTYATVIDLVGKYQLEMQQVFSYAPMARSMGRCFRKRRFIWAAAGRCSKRSGRWRRAAKATTASRIFRRALNLWIPRGTRDVRQRARRRDRGHVWLQGQDQRHRSAEYIEEVRGVMSATPTCDGAGAIAQLPRGRRRSC